MINPTDSQFHALLIGIDDYESIQTDSPMYKNLGGCVRDINLVAGYLENTLQIPEAQIRKLTAPVQESNKIAEIKATEGTILPTYENIVKAFKQVTAAANPREQVYIHYSGHGGRAVTNYPELEGEQRQDEGIVPMDIGGSEGRYLRDIEMATLLKCLTDKGCIVTVIFDSCHSGGATRGDCAIRGNENNLVDATARNQESLVASREELLKNWRILTQADPNLSAGWLPNKDYVFLAACRPTEYAYEYAVNGGQRHGALTYWMINTLTSCNRTLTYKELFSRVKGRIQSKFSQQSPILTGDGDRRVFGEQRQYTPYTITVIKVSNDGKEITLDAGLAAGLSRGTRFAIYPVDVSDVSDKTQQIAIAELTEDIQADQSTAEILEAAAGGIEVKGAIEPGAAAVMVAAPVDLIRKVRLFAQKETGDKEQDLPPALVDKQTAALEKLRQALAGNGWVVEVADGEEAHYQVAVDREGAYEICIGMPIKNLRPPLSIDDPEAPKKVVTRLVHLAKYQAVQALDNPASDISDYLEFQLCDKHKQPFPDPQNVSLKPKEFCYLRVKNTYSQPLNVAVFDVEPTWAISQVPVQGDLSSFVPIDPGQEKFTKLSLQLPADYEQTQETLKIFATKGLANFQWLILPALDDELKTRGNLNLQLKNQAEGLITRGKAHTINPLNHLLSEIGGDLDHPPEQTRAMIYQADPEAEWATQQIQITVKQ